MGSVIEIQDLEHLESVVDKSGSCLVVVFCYTRSCGACKALLAEFQALCEEVQWTVEVAASARLISTKSAVACTRSIESTGFLCKYHHTFASMGLLLDLHVHGLQQCLQAMSMASTTLNSDSKAVCPPAAGQGPAGASRVRSAQPVE